MPGGCRFRKALWAEAAEVAREHGVFRTAKVLRLEYGKLKRLAALSSPVMPESRTARRTTGRVRGVTGAWGGRRLGVPDRGGRPAGQAAHPVEGRHGSRLGRVQPDMVGVGVIQVAPQMRILVAIEAVDLRKGIDGLAQLCREKLGADPFSGCLFIFRSRRATAIKVLAFDGQGFWMAQKRLSKGRFVWWPTGKEATRDLQAHQAQLLFAAGNPETAAAPVWRKVS